MPMAAILCACAGLAEALGQGIKPTTTDRRAHARPRHRPENAAGIPLGNGRDRSVGVKKNGPSRGRTLIDAQDINVTCASRPTHGLHNTMIYRHRDRTFAGGAGVADLGSERQQGLGCDAGGRPCQLRGGGGHRCRPARPIGLRQVDDAAHDRRTRQRRRAHPDRRPDVTALRRRGAGIAMVFQSYALFPHLTVADNIIFGLRSAVRRDRARRRLARRGAARAGSRCSSASRRSCPAASSSASRSAGRSSPRRRSA